MSERTIEAWKNMVPEAVAAGSILSRSDPTELGHRVVEPLYAAPQTPSSEAHERGIVERLVDAALSILHHDGGADEEDRWERDQLTKKFKDIVSGKRAALSAKEDQR